jgi:hypothetical protein
VLGENALERGLEGLHAVGDVELLDEGALFLLGVDFVAA